MALTRPCPCLSRRLPAHSGEGVGGVGGDLIWRPGTGCPCAELGVRERERGREGGRGRGRETGARLPSEATAVAHAARPAPWRCGAGAGLALTRPCPCLSALSVSVGGGRPVRRRGDAAAALCLSATGVLALRRTCLLGAGRAGPTPGPRGCRARRRKRDGDTHGPQLLMCAPKKLYKRLQLVCITRKIRYWSLSHFFSKA